MCSKAFAFYTAGVALAFTGLGCGEFITGAMTGAEIMRYAFYAVAFIACGVFLCWRGEITQENENPGREPEKGVRDDGR